MKLLALLMAVIVVGATIVTNLGYGEQAFGFLRFVPGRDVTGHFVLFGLLGFAVISGFSQYSRIRVAGLLAVVIVLEEMSQGFIAARTFSLVDLAASLAGLLVGFLGSLCVPGNRGRSRAAAQGDTPPPVGTS